MNILQRLLMECELDLDAITEKLDRAAHHASVHDAHAARRLREMSAWLTDVGDELASLAGHPRDVPDYHDEVRR